LSAKKANLKLSTGQALKLPLFDALLVTFDLVKALLTMQEHCPKPTLPHGAAAAALDVHLAVTHRGEHRLYGIGGVQRLPQ
jgi:hypothetical protein